MAHPVLALGSPGMFRGEDTHLKEKKIFSCAQDLIDHIIKAHSLAIVEVEKLNNKKF